MDKMDPRVQKNFLDFFLIFFPSLALNFGQESHFWLKSKKVRYLIFWDPDLMDKIDPRVRKN